MKKTMKKPWDVCCFPAKKLEVCSRSKCQDAYRPLVRRDLWPLSHGRGGFRASPWYDLVALKAWEQRIRLLRLCCFHPDDSLGVFYTWNIFNVCDRKKFVARCWLHDKVLFFVAGTASLAFALIFHSCSLVRWRYNPAPCIQPQLPATNFAEVEYCRANGISMVPRLIGQAPVIALVCEM